MAYVTCIIFLLYSTELDRPGVEGNCHGFVFTSYLHPLSSGCRWPRVGDLPVLSLGEVPPPPPPQHIKVALVCQQVALPE